MRTNNSSLRRFFWSFVVVFVAAIITIKDPERSEKSLTVGNVGSTPASANISPVVSETESHGPGYREGMRKMVDLRPGEGGWIPYPDVVVDSDKHVWVSSVYVYRDKEGSFPFRLEYTRTGWHLAYKGKQPHVIETEEVDDHGGLVWITHFSGFTIKE